MTRQPITEAEVQRACLDLLRLRGLVLIRLNSGVLRNPKGRPVRFGEPGLPDLAFVGPGGRACFVEVKRPGGRPSAAQRAALDRLRRAGACALVVTDVAQLAAALDRLSIDPDATLTEEDLC